MSKLSRLAELKKQLYYCQDSLYNLEYNETTETYHDHLNRKLDDLFEEINDLTDKVNKNINK